MKLLLAILGALVPSTLASLELVPGASWTATNGEHLQAHGAGFIEEDGTYYMVGEDKTNGTNFLNINCYSSTDLVQWKYVGALLSQTESGDLGPGRVVERPKVIYNDKTKKYVLYVHIDSSNYGEAKVGVATGDSVCGKYDYLGSFQPNGNTSRDMTLFKDDDGSGYLISEDRPNGLHIYKLTDDYHNVSSETYLFPDPGNVEAPALIKRDGLYYLFGSHLSGWSNNDNVYTTSKSLSSGWADWKTFADVGSNTYESQTTFVLSIDDKQIMYMGDRWVSENLMTSTYVWLPLNINGTSVIMKWYDQWVPNLLSQSGFLAAPANTTIQGENGTYDGDARNISCSGCSGGYAAGYIGGPDGGSVTLRDFEAKDSAETTVTFEYRNGDSGTRYANVTFNDLPPQKVAFLTTGGAVKRSVINTQLKAGPYNTIVIDGYDTGYGPDIDRVEVPLE
ncbi:carbohydrate-binding module family 35 protein [Penicillium argentinense]|uniref:Carbohydrate-binding module family 35 protein n=1 Tax=Penicillium argentinense TaxID=1131581 RepID=A0A9W9FFB3_9EURO|nr:carbohydrate-binding module family 35 protein [Penicillium argentinense]KAJ5099173.1 carbohydrate-binding module family 35 protein [Penicillium argentinense]